MKELIVFCAVSITIVSATIDPRDLNVPDFINAGETLIYGLNALKEQNVASYEIEAIDDADKYCLCKTGYIYDTLLMDSTNNSKRCKISILIADCAMDLNCEGATPIFFETPNKSTIELECEGEQPIKLVYD